MQTCDRCEKQCYATIMSMFNTDVICMECKKKEEQRPDYRKAVDAENKAIKQGNSNFKGIGYGN